MRIIAPMSERFESDELIYRGKVVECHKIGLRMPDGQVVQRDFLHYGGAVVVLPVLEDGTIVMIRNYRFAVDEELIELPAGMLEEGEAPADCAARELAEETGYTAGRLVKLGQFYAGPGTTDELMHSFLATELKDGDQNLEVHEEIVVEEYSEEDVKRMIADGEIHDAKTIATLGYYWLR